MVDFDGVDVRQHARDAGQRGLVIVVSAKNFAVVSGVAVQTSEDETQQALKAIQPGIDIVARGPADCDFAGQQPREFETGAALDVAAAGIAREAVAIEQEVVHAVVAFTSPNGFRPGIRS